MFSLSVLLGWSSAVRFPQLLRSSVSFPHGYCSTVSCLEFTLSESFLAFLRVTVLSPGKPPRLFCQSDLFAFDSTLHFSHWQQNMSLVSQDFHSGSFRLNPRDDLEGWFSNLTFLRHYNFISNPTKFTQLNQPTRQHKYKWKKPSFFPFVWQSTPGNHLSL